VEGPDGNVTTVYRVTGELFFASSNDLYTQFEYADDPESVVTDMSQSHIWDASTVASLDAIVTKYERKGKRASTYSGSTTQAPNATAASPENCLPIGATEGVLPRGADAR
jgi:MFS superfamily sulfate permease-like transporter